MFIQQSWKFVLPIAVTYSRLLQSLRHQFLSSNLTQRVGGNAANGVADDDHRGRGPSGHSNAVGGNPTQVQPISDLEQRQRQAVIDWARSGQTSGQGLPGQIPAFRPFSGSGGHGKNSAEATDLASHQQNEPLTVDPFLDTGQRRSAEGTLGDESQPDIDSGRVSVQPFSEHSTGTANQLEENLQDLILLHGELLGISSSSKVFSDTR